MLATLDDRLRRGRHGSPTAAPATAPATDAAPTAMISAPARTHAKLFVRIDDTGHSFLGGQAIDAATLDELLQMSHRDDPDTEIVIQATTHAPRAAIVDLLDHAKTAGLQRYSFAAP